MDMKSSDEGGRDVLRQAQAGEGEGGEGPEGADDEEAGASPSWCEGRPGELWGAWPDENGSDLL